MYSIAHTYFWGKLYILHVYYAYKKTAPKWRKLAIKTQLDVYLISRKARTKQRKSAVRSVEFFRYEGFQVFSFHANNSLHPQVLKATSRTNYKRFVSSALSGSRSRHLININGTTLMLGLPSAIYVA